MGNNTKTLTSFTSKENLRKLVQEKASDTCFEILINQIKKESEEEEISYIGHFNEQAVPKEERAILSRLNLWIKKNSDPKSLVEISTDLLAISSNGHLRTYLLERLFTKSLIKKIPVTETSSGDGLFLTTTVKGTEARIWFQKPTIIEDGHISSDTKSDLMFGIYHDKDEIKKFAKKVQKIFPEIKVLNF
jgi:hypothetical protein